nr:ribulose-phosphate 3-epimerase [Saprospiraceae bacterium]
LPIIKAINSATDKFLDVHLMISNPQLYIKDYAAAGAQNLTVHYEVCDHLHRVIQAIKAEGMQAGVALNPHTPVQVLKDILHDLDLVCIMSVNPGFGGQSFIEHTYSKVSELHELKAKTNSTAKVQIDGGVSIANARQLVYVGAQVLVAGSAVFKAERPIQMIEKLMHV